MVERLRQAIQAGSPLLLGLNAGNVFHAIAPYRLVTVSSNETHIYVYDSEAPGQQQVVRLQRSGSGWQWQYTFTGSLASAGTRTGGCRDMVYYRAATSLSAVCPSSTSAKMPRRSVRQSRLRRLARTGCSPCCLQLATG